MPSRLESITYEIIVNTVAPDRRLDLLHANVRKYGTIFNTVAPGNELTGELHRMSASP